MPSTDTVLSCERLVKVYHSPTGRVEAVRGIDLDIEERQAVAVVGPSGSGKSSLLRMLAGLDEPTAGRVQIAARDLSLLGPGRRARLRAKLLTHVYQVPSENLIAHLTAQQQLLRIARPRYMAAEIVNGVLEKLGLHHRREHRPEMMSGGEQQRLAFARAAVAGHRLVIADEPTAELDADSAETILETIDLLVRRGTSVVVATHDARVFERMDQVITLRDGAVSSVRASGGELAVIDRAGRLQLPPDVAARYPKRKARVTWDEETGRFTILPP